MNIALGLLIVTALVIIYALYGRPWFMKQAWAQGFYAWIEPVEILFFRKSESVLMARFWQLMGVTVALLIQLGQIDLTVIAPFISDEHRWMLSLAPLGLNVLGMIDEKLRNRVTKPIEVVAAPVAVSPETAAVVAAAADANAVAVDMVKAEKAA